MAAAPPPDGEAQVAAPTRLAPAELGARLVAQREAAGMTVDDIASRTRIRPSLIRSMEQGEFSPCGGAVYARGHLRSIAGIVHADAGDLLAAYDRMSGEPSPSATRVVDEHYEEKPAPVPFARVAAAPPRPPVRVTGTREDVPARAVPAGGPTIRLPGADQVRERRGSPWVLAAVAVTAVVVVVALVALIGANRSGHHPAAVGSPGHSTSAHPTTPATTSASRPPSTAPTVAGVNVTVKVGASASWVHVADNSGAVLFQGVVPAGSSKTFHAAKQLKFIFGNAPAVDLVYNGKDVGSPPATKGGVVADAVFTA